MANATVNTEYESARYFPDLPFLIWLILVTLVIGLVAGFDAKQIIHTFNAGWGMAAGEFALILLPSFILAAAIGKQQVAIPEPVSVGLAPVVGAGMICPDTAYAALSPMVRKRRLSLAFGAYAGFKLLFPAGPLIIATSLGVADASLLFYCFVIFIPVWFVGLAYGTAVERTLLTGSDDVDNRPATTLFATLSPFALLIVLLAAGALLDLSFNSWVDFATNPKGALILSAAAALSMVPRQERRSCVDSGVRRTGSLLLIIGAASAFSAFVVAIVPVDQIFTPQSGMIALITLFTMTGLFKLLQGSSMSTFAAAGPVAAPIVAASEVSPVAAVIAICLGSFVAILPNDSFYWLIRKNALVAETELKSTMILGAGSILQAVAGLGLLLGLYALVIS
mmetsp:Transcript_156/g.504  ORF Transcript_156/g.504 Transcript_156/m.504 type:complete len:394 (+) Transcript_156:194-1375(+)